MSETSSVQTPMLLGCWRLGVFQTMGDFINSISITLLVTAMIHVINYGSSIVAIFFGCSVKVKLVGYFINISAG